MYTAQNLGGMNLWQISVKYFGRESLMVAQQVKGLNLQINLVCVILENFDKLVFV